MDATLAGAGQLHSSIDVVLIDAHMPGMVSELLAELS